MPVGKSMYWPFQAARYIIYTSMRGETVGDYTSLLFGKQTILTGMASVLDLSGSMMQFNQSPSGEQADLSAMARDFRAVGSDMKMAIQCEMQGNHGDDKA